MVDWDKLKEAYETVRREVVDRAEGEGFVVYNMKNGVIRIDIKDNS